MWHFHFDVNKTVILTDAASGQTLHESVASVLAENTRGSEGPDRRWRIDAAGDVTYGVWSNRRMGKEEAKRARRLFVEQGEPGETLAAECAVLERAAERSGYFVEAFVVFVKWLARSGLRWRLYFRTFGSDLPEVEHHWAELCRAQGLPEAQHMQRGEFKRASRHCSSLSMAGERHEGMAAIARALNGNAVLATGLREDYAFWSEASEHRECGKLLLVEQRDETAAHRHFFFDDNAHVRIDAPHENIVDVRMREADSEEYRTVSDGEARDKYFAEVNPLHMLRDPLYYVNKVKALTGLNQ